MRRFAFGPSLGGLGLALVLASCGENENFEVPEWELTATVDETSRELVIRARYATVHDNDFVHMSIRKDGWDNAFSDRTEEGVDWTRPNRWFGEFHTDTWLEGGMYPGDGDYTRPPQEFQDYEYRLSLDPAPRTNWPDRMGSPFNYVTRGYSVYDSHREHPGFEPGEYEVELYAWYTGSPNELHPAVGDETKVQYVHYEREIITTRFTVD